MEKTRYNQKDIAVVGLMIALVFIGTFYFKIPTAFGYTHLGDCMIILATRLLGTKKGAIAGALGAGLADFIGGYTAWVLPTMAFKAAWVFVMGFIAFKLFKNFNSSTVVLKRLAILYRVSPGTTVYVDGTLGVSCFIPSGIISF